MATRVAASGAPGASGGAGPGGPGGPGSGAAARALEGFHSLRAEQRALANKLSELEQELNEHKIVIDTLKVVNEDRKCFQMIGGVLFEKTVKEVLPVLITNKDLISKVITSLTDQLAKKGTEINDYKEKHDIRIRGQNDIAQQEEKSEQKTSKSNVLVSNN